jgi:hypothetical protein
LFDIRVLLMERSKPTFSDPPEGKNAHFRLRQQARAPGCDCPSVERDDAIVARALSARTAFAMPAPAKQQKCVSLG